MGMGLGAKIKAAVSETRAKSKPSQPESDRLVSAELVDFMGAPIGEPPPSTVDIIESVLEEDAKEISSLAPSDFFGCPRACVFRYRNAARSPARMPPKMKRIVDEGSKVHEILQRYLGNERHKYWFIPEAKNFMTIEGVNVAGSCDGILVRREDGYKWAIEIKSISEKGWDDLKKSPKTDHARQAVLYAMSQRIWWITVLYWHKGTQELKEYPIHVTEKRYQEVLAAAREVKPFLLDKKEKSLPAFEKRLCNPMFCKFTKTCRAFGGDPPEPFIW